MEQQQNSSTVAPPSAEVLPYAVSWRIALPPEWTNAAYFAADPAAARRRVIRLALSQATGIALLSANSAIGMIAGPGVTSGGSVGWILVPVIGVPLILTAAAVAWLVRSERRRWPRYCLVIADQGMLVHDGSGDDIRVDAREVTRIIIVGDQYLMKLGFQRVGVCNSVQDEPLARARLQAWGKPCQTPSRAAIFLRSAGGLSLMLLVMGAYWYGMLSGRRELRTAAYVLIFAVCGFGVFHLMRLRNFPWAARLAVLFSIITVVVLLFILAR